MLRRLPAWLVTLALLASPALAQPAPAGSRDQPAPPQGAGAPAAAQPAVPSWGSLISHVGGDARRLSSWETATVLGAAGAVSLAVHGEDARVTRSASQSERLDAAFEAGALSGSWMIQAGGAFATYALGRATGSPRLAIVGADLVRAQVVAAALTHGIKLSVRRTRPDGERFSFPSGHSSAAFATAAVLQRHLGWRAGVPAYAVGAYIGASRLQENKHYLSDVIFGAALGVVSGRSVTIGRGRTTFAVTAVPLPGGGGIGLTLRAAG